MKPRKILLNIFILSRLFKSLGIATTYLLGTLVLKLMVSLSFSRPKQPIYRGGGGGSTDSFSAVEGNGRRKKPS